MATYNKEPTDHPVERMHRKLTRTTVALLLAGTLLGSLAIGGAVVAQEAPIEQTQEESPTQETTYLRVVHASPDAPAVDIYINETVNESSTTMSIDNESSLMNESVDNESTPMNVSLMNVTFSNMSEYMTLEAGSYNVTITAAGDREAVVYEDTVTFDARTVTTLVASGEIGEETTTEDEFGEETTTEDEFGEETTTEDEFSEETTTEDEFGEETTTEDEFSEEATTEDEFGEETTTENEMDENAVKPFAPVMYDDDALRPAANDSAIRIVHLSPDAPTVDVTTANGTVLADGLSFQESSEYMTVPAGDYEVQIRADAPAQNGTVVTTVNVTVENETAYSAMALGYLNATDEQVPFEVALTEDATRTVHLPMEAENETEA